MRSVLKCLAWLTLLAPVIGGAQQSTADSIVAACVARDTSTAWIRANQSWSDNQPGAWSNDSLRLVLIEMGEADQAGRSMHPDSIRDSTYLRRQAQRDSMGMEQLRGIIRKFGWPTKSLVGARGASAAFLIAQHNGPIQEEALRLMRALPPGEVLRADMAMLEDRILTTKGRQQKYGTQFKPSTGEAIEFFPIENVAFLEARRADVGLPPMNVYLCMMQAFTGQKPVFPPKN